MVNLLILGKTVSEELRYFVCTMAACFVVTVSATAMHGAHHASHRPAGSRLRVTEADTSPSVLMTRPRVRLVAA
eukprot:78744-Pleurochrysis_carterae.AAC.1